MKLNNKGFAISTILYGLLTLLIMILMLTFEIMRTGNNNNKDLSDKIKDFLDGPSGNCRKARIEYNNCVGDCTNEKDKFDDNC